MNGVFEWLINGVLPGAATFGVASTATFTRRRTNSHRRWRLKDPSSLRICVAKSTSIDTGVYTKPATGIGQAKALALITPSLIRGWRDIDLQQVWFADSITGSSIEGDLILLGGPKHNELTAEAFRLLGHRFGVYQEDSVISIGDGGSGDHQVVCGTVESRDVRTDYGLVLCARSPWSPEHRLVLISGCHTYGVVAAARYMVESKEVRNAPEEFAAVVESRIREGHTLSPTTFWTSS